MYMNAKNHLLTDRYISKMTKSINLIFEIVVPIGLEVMC